MRFKLAYLPTWVQRQKDKLDLLAQQSTSDVIERAAQTAAGVTRGGTVTRGYVPRADGVLAASLTSTLTGTSSLTSAGGNYGLVAGSMQAGSRARFEWRAAHAAKRHYGDQYHDGWFWVDEALLHWQTIVDNVIARLREL